MSDTAIKSPLSVGRHYLDRRNRIWRVTRITNAGRAGIACLPALAHAVCVDANAADDVDTRYPQWVNAMTGWWSEARRSELDLVRTAP